jgi:type IV pilus assembly protein PilB
MKENKLILEMLLKNEEITRKDILDRISKAERNGMTILDLLIQDQIITSEKLLLLFHKEWGCEVYNPQKDPFDSKVIELFTVEEVCRFTIFPLNQPDEKSLSILITDPTNEETIRKIQTITNKRIKLLVTGKACIMGLIHRYYSDNRNDMVKENDYKSEDDDELGIVALVNKLINDSVLQGVSDIHIEAFSKKNHIRFRIDGILQVVMEISQETYCGLITRLKILGKCDIAKHRLPQDGSFSTEYEGRQIDIRLSVIPTIHGEKIVLRVLDQQRLLIQFNDLGFSKEQESIVKEMIEAPYGMILTSGPTGSGKTTTLYSLINDMNPEIQNIITIEDPVEFQMEDINQIQVNEKTGLSFATGLRSILRQDPDVIMVGEIRDEETASIAIRASITGHLVLSTIHTNNAISSITRLMDMKVPLYLLSSSMRGVISQKLIKKLCPNCKEKIVASSEEKMLLKCDEETLCLWHPVGCSLCRGTGYYGRIAIQEVLKISQKIRSAINQGETYDRIREIAREEGMISLEVGLKDRILEGTTSLEEGMKLLIFESQ